MGQLAERGPGTKVLLTWEEWIGQTVTDAVTGVKSAAVNEQGQELGHLERQQQIVKGFFYQVNASSVVREFNEIEAGNAILDLPPDVELEDASGQPLEGLRFVITVEGPGGRTYTDEWVQKEVSERLARSWDVVVQGRRLGRTVLVRKAT
jgi:hypothetical protein